MCAVNGVTTILHYARPVADNIVGALYHKL